MEARHWAWNELVKTLNTVRPIHGINSAVVGVGKIGNEYPRIGIELTQLRKRVEGAMESGAAKPKNWNVHWAVGIINKPAKASDWKLEDPRTPELFVGVSVYQGNRAFEKAERKLLVAELSSLKVALPGLEWGEGTSTNVWPLSANIPIKIGSKKLKAHEYKAAVISAFFTGYQSLSSDLK